MPEVVIDFPRDWVEFDNPADPFGERFRCDLTWLTSNWTCIYGNGCKGIYADRPNDGCCSEGALYSDKKDEERVLKFAKKLKKSQWQYFDKAQPKKKGGKLKISEVDEDGDRKTRKVDNGCIFLNRKGHTAEDFTGDFGCVLHHLAQSEGVHFVKTKPDVCWQLPIRRSFEKVDLGDDVEVSITVIGEYESRGWGPGGEDFHWYCTSNSDAHVGKEPVYISHEAELTELMGKKAYAELKQICDARMEIKRAASPKLLPFLLEHPATTLARKEAAAKSQ